jgi:hypothetical protein
VKPARLSWRKAERCEVMRTSPAVKKTRVQFAVGRKGGRSEMGTALYGEENPNEMTRPADVPSAKQSADAGQIITARRGNQEAVIF